MKHTRALVVAAFVAGWMGAVSVGAQFLASDQVPQERTIPEKQQIDDDMARAASCTSAPFGSFPSISVQNAGYDSNVFSTSTNPFADWTSRSRRAPIFCFRWGRRCICDANVFPALHLVRQAERPRSMGRPVRPVAARLLQSVDLSGDRHRIGRTTSCTAPSCRRTSSRISRAPRPASSSTLTRSLSAFADGGYQQVRYTQYSGPPLQDVQVKLNNSDDSEVRGGLRYSISKEWTVSALAEETWSNFQYESELRDNRSTRVSRRHLLQPPEPVRQRRGRIPGGQVLQRLALPRVPDARGLVLSVVLPDPLDRAPRLRRPQGAVQHQRLQSVLLRQHGGRRARISSSSTMFSCVVSFRTGRTSTRKSRSRAANS